MVCYSTCMLPRSWAHIRQHVHSSCHSPASTLGSRCGHLERGVVFKYACSCVAVVFFTGSMFSLFTLSQFSMWPLFIIQPLYPLPSLSAQCLTFIFYEMIRTPCACIQQRPGVVTATPFCEQNEVILINRWTSTLHSWQQIASICPSLFHCLWWFYRCQPVELQARYANASWQNKYPGMSKNVKEKVAKNTHSVQKKGEKNDLVCAFKTKTIEPSYCGKQCDIGSFPAKQAQRNWSNSMPKGKPYLLHPNANLHYFRTHEQLPGSVFTPSWQVRGITFSSVLSLLLNISCKARLATNFRCFSSVALSFLIILLIFFQVMVLLILTAMLIWFYGELLLFS